MKRFIVFFLALVSILSSCELPTDPPPNLLGSFSCTYKRTWGDPIGKDSIENFLSYVSITENPKDGSNYEGGITIRLFSDINDSINSTFQLYRFSTEYLNDGAYVVDKDKNMNELDTLFKYIRITKSAP